MKESEIKAIAKKGGKAIATPVALDALSVVVHPKNPVANMTMEQIKQIFTGQTTNWKDVGGPDKPIVVFTRESTSGTYGFFQEHVMANEKYLTSAKQQPSNGAIVEGVADAETAIGYIGFGYLQDCSGKVKAISVAGVMPSEVAVYNDTYKLARYLFLCSNGEPTGAAKDFVTFCLSPEGQEVVKKVGFMALKK